MIKMQIRHVWQAICPFCQKTINLSYKKEEMYCNCDEKVGYSMKFENDD